LPRCVIQDQGALDTVLVSRAKLFAISGAAPLSNWQQLEIVVRQWDAMEAARQEDGPLVHLISRTKISRFDLA